MTLDPADLILAADGPDLLRLADSWTTLPVEARQLVAGVLPGALLIRYLESQHREWLDAASAFVRGCLDAEDLDRDVRFSLRANLVVCLQQDHALTGRADPLEEGIAESRALLDEDDVSGDERAGRIATLGHLYASRAVGFNSPLDLTRAVRTLEQAVAVPGVGEEKAAECLSDLARALRDRFNQGGDVEDLARARTALQDAVVRGRPDTPSGITNRINLASVRRRYGALTRDLSGIADSIAELRVLIEGHGISSAHCLYNLGLSYREAFRLTGDPADLRAAVGDLRDALSRSGGRDELSSGIAVHLAEALLLADDGAAEAEGLLEAVATHLAATVSERFRAVITLATRRSGDAALPAWRHAVTLLPLLAWRGSRYRDREASIGRSAGVARDAAGCAADVGEPQEAITMLEAGRGVLWNQLLDNRADLDLLRAVRPDLAGRMAALRAELDRTHHA